MLKHGIRLTQTTLTRRDGKWALKVCDKHTIRIDNGDRGGIIAGIYTNEVFPLHFLPRTSATLLSTPFTNTYALSSSYFFESSIASLMETLTGTSLRNISS